jgi:transposase
MIRRGIVMGKAYSQDLRERVMAAVDAGTGAYAVASFFRVSVSYIYKALGGGRGRGRRARVLGPVAPNRSSPHMTTRFAPM